MSWAKAVGDSFLEHDHRTSSFPHVCSSRPPRPSHRGRAGEQEAGPSDVAGRWSKPDAQLFSQTRVAGGLKTPGKCSRVRAKAAHFPRALTKKSREQ